MLLSFIYLISTPVIGLTLFNLLNSLIPINKNLYILLFCIVSMPYIIYRYSYKHLTYSIGKILTIISSYYIAFLIYLIILLPLSFLLDISLPLPHMNYYLCAFILSTIIVILGLYKANITQLKEYSITTSKPLHSNLKIALVSDLHLGYLIGPDKLDKLINILNNLNADLVIIAGDIADKSLLPLINDNMLSHLQNIESKYGTYFSLGNHDFYAGEDDKLCKLLKDNGINVLRDESSLINNEFYIIGRDSSACKKFGKTRLHLNKILQTVDMDKFTILIDHSPSHIDDSIFNNIDLQLSGHTHKGQIFPVNIISKIRYQLYYGYRRFNNTDLIVSSGFGYSNSAIRTIGHSEVVLINITHS